MGDWSWEAAFHGWVHTATLAVATVLALFVLVLGSFGNGLVLLSALRRRHKRSNLDLLILNLSAADLLLCVVLAPLYLYTLFQDPPFPRLFCGSLLLGGTGCGLLSLLSIVAIAVHRQARVVGRAKRSLTRRQTGVALGAVWALSGAGAVGATLHAMLDWRDSYRSCQVLIYSSDPLLHRFTLFFLGPLVLISFIIIVVAYAVISRAVRAQSRSRQQGLPALYRSTPVVRGRQKDVLVVDRTQPEWPQRRGAPRQCQCCSCQAAAERESKAVTMCVVVMVTLLLCWSPLLVSQFIELATGPSIVLLQVKLCGIALVFLNSALDPYMYAQNHSQAHSTRYGRLCWDVLRCQCAASPRSRTRFRALRTRPVPDMPRSSLLDNNTPSVPAPDKALDDRAATQVGRKEGSGSQGCGMLCGDSCRATDRLLPKQVVQGRCGPCTFQTGPLPPWQTVLTPQTPVTPTPIPTPQVIGAGGLGVHRCRAACRPKVGMRDVRSLVHKSCCHLHVASDQSLVES